MARSKELADHICILASGMRMSNVIYRQHSLLPTPIQDQCFRYITWRMYYMVAHHRQVDMHTRTVT